MLRNSTGASRGLRWFALSFAAVWLAGASGSADARNHRARHSAHYAARAESYEPPYSDIVVDANSGAVLHATNPNAPRHPASLTKMMTLYLLFERLEASKIKLDTPIEISAKAASQPPSKLDLKPGETIAVEDAIKAVVTRSANDVAEAIGEALGGNEGNFAEMMTHKAHALGMSQTEYRNASGLPDDEQVTTAHDQALLARALQDRFPRYYRYFSTSIFNYKGEAIRNHNHLLGRVEGVDGIKTGYIRASGFNLVTSMHRGDRHIVGVIFGGSSAGSRDERMRELVSEYITVASTHRSVSTVAENRDATPQTRVKVAEAGDAAAEPNQSAHATAAPASPPPPMPVNRSAARAADAIRPILVKTVSVKAGIVQMASLAPLVPSARASAPAPAGPAAPEAISASPPSSAKAEPALPPPGPAPGVLEALPIRAAPAAEVEAAPPSLTFSERLALATPPAEHAHGGWMIQVGAFDAEAEAKDRLNSVQDLAKDLLGAADPFTEKVQKGDRAIYRARFAGLDQEHAEAVCKHLKHNDIACMTLKN
ncbi:MAG: D-alanyl-D-alanine carboxypeptidase [Xanthobacteraceae bacterium]